MVKDITIEQIKELLRCLPEEIVARNLTSKKVLKKIVEEELLWCVDYPKWAEETWYTNTVTLANDKKVSVLDVVRRLEKEEPKYYKELKEDILLRYEFLD